MDHNSGNSFLESYKKKTGATGQEVAQNPEPVGNAEPERTKDPGPDIETDMNTEMAAASQEAPPSLHFETRSSFTRPHLQRSRNASEPVREGKPGRVIGIAAGAVVVVLAAIGLIWLLNRGVAVMDFTNWSLNDAQLWSSDTGVNLQTEEQFNDQYDAGKIFAQDPAPGTTVKKGGFVKLTVSTGHDLSVTLPLPDLMNMTKDEIDAWAAANFMTKVRITAEFSNDVEAGKVISYEINDNTVVDQVRRNSPVYVIVSKGSEDAAAALITVPNFREKTIADSYVFANENGILLTVNEQFDNYAPKGSIIAQSVKADEKVRKGDTITLTVSKGKEIMVPDFSDYTKEKASTVATQLGIPVTILEKYSGSKAGAFLSQSVAKDTVYQDGEVIELTYSLGNQIVLASYVGQTRDVIETWAKDLNDKGASITIKTTYTQSSAPKGQIIYQDKANTVIGNKATINITVSQGKVVFVPDFVGPEGSGYDVAITREEAMTMCEAAKLIPVFVSKSSSTRLPGEVYAQSVAAGTEVNEGTTITLTYNPANAQTTVPDFTGKTKAEILGGAYNKSLDIIFETAEEYVDGYANKICKQSVRAGSSVAVGSPITLTISPDAPSAPPSGP